jgi:hypothetical protein
MAVKPIRRHKGILFARQRLRLAVLYPQLSASQAIADAMVAVLCARITDLLDGSVLNVEGVSGLL